MILSIPELKVLCVCITVSEKCYMVLDLFYRMLYLKEVGHSPQHTLLRQTNMFLARETYFLFILGVILKYNRTINL